MKIATRTWRFAATATVLAGGVSALFLSPAFSSSPSALGPVNNCTASQLHVTHGPVTAGFMPEGRKLTTPIIFTNSGPACAIWGVPSVQTVVGSNHAAVGGLAKNLSMGEMGVRHVVKTGGTVSAKFTDSVYFSLATCHVTNADGIVVTLGGFSSPSYVAMSMTVCTGVTGTTTQLITAGSAG